MEKIQIKPLSVNGCWQGRRYKTDDYKKYERDVLFLLPRIKVGKGNLSVKFVVGYSNRGADIDNFVKPVFDIMQKKYGFNDSQVYELHIYKKVVKKGHEYIEFEIIEL